MSKCFKKYLLYFFILILALGCHVRSYNHYFNAQKLLYFQKPDSALKELNQLEELQPEWPRTYTLRSEAYSMMGDYQAALEDVNKALSLIPDNPQKQAELLTSRAFFRQKTLDLEGAERDYKEASRVAPKYVSAFLGLGNLYFQQKRYDQAIEAYDQAIVVRPHFTDALFNRAIVKYIQGNFSGAIDDCDVVLKKDYKYDAALNFRAVLKMQLNFYKGAIRDLNRALELNPLAAPYYYNRSRCYMKINKSRKACRDWKNAKKFGYSSIDLDLSIQCD